MRTKGATTVTEIRLGHRREETAGSAGGRGLGGSLRTCPLHEVEAALKMGKGGRGGGTACAKSPGSEGEGGSGDQGGRWAYGRAAGASGGDFEFYPQQEQDPVCVSKMSSGPPVERG